jgi:hypothetical protein
VGFGFRPEVVHPVDEHRQQASPEHPALAQVLLEQAGCLVARVAELVSS